MPLKQHFIDVLSLIRSTNPMQTRKHFFIGSTCRHARKISKFDRMSNRMFLKCIARKYDIQLRARHWLCARMHFLGRRASSGHNNSFYAGPRGQWLSDRWQTHVPVFLLTYRVSPCDGLTYKYFHPQSYYTCAY